MKGLYKSVKNLTTWVSLSDEPLADFLLNDINGDISTSCSDKQNSVLSDKYTNLCEKRYIRNPSRKLFHLKDDKNCGILMTCVSDDNIPYKSSDDTNDKDTQSKSKKS